MDKDKRETKIVVTSLNDEKFCTCQFCGAVIAELVHDGMVPSAEECYKKGNVPVPNFGWFCSQDCASKYETKYDTRFARIKSGKIDYYSTGADD